MDNRDATRVAYEPHRLVSNGQGEIIENERAPVEFKEAEAAMARKGPDKRWGEQLTLEAQWHRRWVEGERAKGRSETELRWGDCVRETGILGP